MWKCIRCEKENKDTAEICTECGHGRTMDYVQHRTLSKISAKLAKNWKISRNTEKEIKKLNNENRKKIQDLKKKYRQTQLQAKKDATKETPNENRKNAEEVIQKKLSSLRSSVAFMKDEISKEQDEINTLHGTIEERTKMVDKDAKADKILTTIAWIITISLFLYIVYRYGFDGRWAAVGEFFGGMSDWVKFEGTLSIGDILKVVLVIIVFGGIILFAIAMSGIWLLAAVPAGIIGLIIELLIGRFIGTVSDETLKQAKTERDNAQNSIDKKKNEINSIYQKIAPLQKQISKIEGSMSILTDNLSRVLPEHMSEELERWTRRGNKVDFIFCMSRKFRKTHFSPRGESCGDFCR